MMRSLWISQDRHGSPADAAGHHLAQPRQRQHQRLQARARGVRGPDVPEPAPGRAPTAREQTQLPTGLQVGPGVRAGRHRAQLHAGQPAADRQPARRRDQAATASSRCRCPTAPPPTPATARSRSTRKGQLVTTSGYRCSPASRSRPTRRSSPSAATARSASRCRARRRRRRSGQLQLASFINPAGLEPHGQNLFVETAASGTPNAGAPGSNGLGALQQGYVETSNVNVVEELVAMIQTQRAYEINSRRSRPPTRCCRGWRSCDAQRHDDALAGAVARRWRCCSPAGGCEHCTACRQVDIAAAAAGARRSRRRAAAPPRNGAIFQAGQLPAAVRGPPRAPGRRHADGADRREGRAPARSRTSIDRQERRASTPASRALPLISPNSFSRASARGHRQQHLRRQGRHREQQRLHRHHHRDGHRACCPTATCWSPARSRSASTRTSTCSASPAWSTRARSSAGNIGAARRRSPTRASSSAAAAQQAEAQTMGWLARFFLNVLPF